MTAAQAELPADLHARIRDLCAAGDALTESGCLAEALSQYTAALALLPPPYTQWSAATWILAAIGDAQFQSGDFAAGKDSLSLAMHCPDAIGNPFLHLRLGQCRFELGEHRRASDDLARAYILEGLRIFQDEDPKYLAFIKPQLRPPNGGWPTGW